MCVHHSVLLHLLCPIRNLVPSCVSVCHAHPPVPRPPGYSPTRTCCPCWGRVSPPLPLTQSSSHTGCPTAPSTTCCTRAPVSIHGNHHDDDGYNDRKACCLKPLESVPFLTRSNMLIWPYSQLSNGTSGLGVTNASRK